ncbi:MAG: cobalt ABC transporter [Propionibacteriaceae bacterium]|nr:cobalt ABC transporter [Propionibacteriaceae bacterium]
MSSSERFFAEPRLDFEGVLDLLLPTLSRRSDRFVVLIDGGAGAGKTTLAVALQTSLVITGTPAQLVSLDDCYPGWNGLAAASLMVINDMLDPTLPGYRRWNWPGRRPGEWVSLDADRPLIIEGCGALTPMSAALATLSIWLHRDPAERRAAVEVRDRGAFEAHWAQWSAQEALHWSLHRPWNLAGLVCVVGPG